MVRTAQGCEHLMNTRPPADAQLPFLNCQQLAHPNPCTESGPLSVFVNNMLLENSHASSLSVNAFVLKLQS